MRHVAALRGLAAVALAAPLLLAVARAGDAPDPVVAQRGAVTITASQVRQMLAMADPDQRKQMQHDPKLLLQRVQDRLLQLILLDKARAERFEDRPEVAYRARLASENAIAQSFLIAQVPADPGFPTEQAVAEAYAANKQRLLLPRQFRVAQIMIAVPAGATPQAAAAAQKRAAELRRQIVEGRRDFAQIAKQDSDEKVSAARGGELGWVREDTLLPPIRQTLAGMADGAVSQPVRTPDGWHLVKLLGIRPPGPATLAEAHDVIVRAMRQNRDLQAQRRYVGLLLQEEPVRINQAELEKQAAQ